MTPVLTAVGVFTVLAAAVVAVAAILRRVDRRPSAADAVRVYLAALADGDAAAAAAQRPPVSGPFAALHPDADAASLLTTTVLRDAVERISAVEVGVPQTSSGSDGGAVPASFVLAGERIDWLAPVHWHRDVRMWRVGVPLLGAVTLARGSAEQVYLAYPGVYRLPTADSPAVVVRPGGEVLLDARPD